MLKVPDCSLFNLIPRDLRDTNSGTVDQFKFRLDERLATVPDQPTPTHSWTKCFSFPANDLPIVTAQPQP